jgi:glycosyltransferase involved in cell wall biosynthesis
MPVENRKPRVSIGLPVYNGETFLAKSLDATLSQTYEDFELIISDNASTDRTAEICASYTARDSRIKYYRNERNIGGGNNFNRTFELSSGEYFQWTTNDDFSAPEYLSKCVEVLDRDPSVVLCLSAVGQVDEEGKQIGMEDLHEAMSTMPDDRFKVMIGLQHQCQSIYGLMRSEIMRKTLLWLNHTDSDRTFLAEMSLYGKLYQIRETLFFRRTYPGNSIRLYPDWRDRMAWFDPSFRKHLSFPHWAQFFAYLKIIARSPLSLTEQLRCYKHMGFWLGPERHGRSMIKDLILAVIWLLRYPTRFWSQRKNTVAEKQSRERSRSLT